MVFPEDEIMKIRTSRLRNKISVMSLKGKERIL